MRIEAEPEAKSHTRGAEQATSQRTHPIDTGTRCPAWSVKSPSGVKGFLSLHAVSSTTLLLACALSAEHMWLVPSILFDCPVLSLRTLHV
jgi:hypothetical protein